MEQKAQYTERVANGLYKAAAHIVDDRGEPPLWPMNIVETLWYLAKYYPYEVHQTIEKLRLMGLAESEIAELFIFPTRLTYIYHQAEFPIRGLTAKQGGKLFETFMDYVGHYRKEDIYCETSRNILWDEEQVKQALADNRFINLVTDPDADRLRQLMGRLNATMWLFSEFIQAAKHPYSHEFHGPYKVSDDEQLVVRHYYDLKPIEIWPFLARAPYETVTTYEVYRIGAQVGFSFFNHSESTSSLPQYLKRFSVVAGPHDHPVLTLQDLADLQTGYQLAVVEGNKYVAGFNQTDWHTKVLELHFHYLRPHKERLGEDWRPPPEII